MLAQTAPARPTAAAAAALGRFIVDGYDRRSPVAFCLLVGTAASVGYHWRDLLDANGDMDWLLGGIWVVMAALVCWRVSPRRDLALLVVGACGGAVTEWWGTNTGLWHYFTQERPPLWILPAWPIAAVTVDRLARLLDFCLGEADRRRGRGRSSPGFAWAYWITVPGFVLWMMHFVWPYSHIFATQVVIGVMVLVALHRPEPRRDVVMFAAGALLGIFLEYWGTSRACWTYYTGQVPPAVAVLAHGFAAVAFARAASAVTGRLHRVAAFARRAYTTRGAIDSL
jgi:hypothetical protein